MPYYVAFNGTGTYTDSGWNNIMVTEVTQKIPGLEDLFQLKVPLFVTTTYKDL